MSEETTEPVNWSFWTIGIITLIWNLMGVLNYLGQTNADVVATMPETHRAIIESRPAWATGAFAIAVFGSTVGSVLLLLRKSAASYLFIASMIGVIAVMIHTLSLSIDFGPAETVMMVVMPLAVASFLIWYAKRAQSKGWIT